MPIPSAVEEIIVRFRALPAPLRDLLSSEEEANVIEEIERTYQLNAQTTLRLNKSIGLFIMQFISPQEFIAELGKIAPQGKLVDLKRDIVAKVFAPHEKTLHAHGIRFETLAMAAAETPTLAKTLLAPSRSEAPPPTPPPKPAPPPLVISTAPPKPSTAVPAAPTPQIPPAPRPAAPPQPAAPTPVVPPRPIDLPRITITPQQPGVPATPHGEGEKERKPEAEPRPIRYTAPPVVPEVPKVIAPAIPAEPQKPQEPIIDLSTFRVSKNLPTPNLPPGETPQPKAKGNVLDLKP